MFINSCCLLTNNISFLPFRPVTEGAGMEGHEISENAPIRSFGELASPCL